MTFYDENPLGGYLASSATEGMWPWVPETVSIYTDYAIDDDIERVTVEARRPSWGNWLFYARVEIPRAVFLDLPTGEGWVEATRDLLVWGFRSREALPVNDNIELGES